MTQKLEEIRIGNQTRAYDNARHWNSLANNSTDNLSKIFINIVSIILPLSIIPFSSENVTQMLNFVDITLVASSWLALFFSIVFGCLYIYKQAYYFRDISRESYAVAKIYSKPIINEDYNLAYKMYASMYQEEARLKKIPNDLDKTFLKLQTILLFIPTLILIIIFCKVLLCSYER